MTKRTPKQQSKHDNGVLKTAKYYQKKGFQVDADLKDSSKPKTIGGRRPDVIAKKGKQEIVVEVETTDSLGKDKNQQKTFQSYADKSSSRGRHPSILNT